MMPKQLFLLDGLGALLTAFLLGIVLVRLEPVIGMPAHLLYMLSAVACVFAVYSFSNVLFPKANWRPYLIAIAIANLVYCCLTLGLMIYLRHELSTLGKVYFTLEIAVIIGLVSMELKTAYT